MKERPNYCCQCIYYKSMPRYGKERGRCEKIATNVARLDKPCDAGWTQKEEEEE